jgi:hypothetical protein
MFNPITLQEVTVAAENAAFIANCPCPARYRSTQWEEIWRETRRQGMVRLGLIS